MSFRHQKNTNRLQNASMQLWGPATVCQRFPTKTPRNWVAIRQPRSTSFKGGASRSAGHVPDAGQPLHHGRRDVRAVVGARAGLGVQLQRAPASWQCHRAPLRPRRDRRAEVGEEDDGVGPRRVGGVDPHADLRVERPAQRPTANAGSRQAQLRRAMPSMQHHTQMTVLCGVGLCSPEAANVGHLRGGQAQQR